MDGIAAVQQRIAAIESRFGAARTAGVAGATAARPAGAPGATKAAGATSFADTLTAAVEQQQQSSSAAPRLTPAERLAPGSYGKLQPPAELARFGNGRIPASAMSTFGVGQHRLHEPAAQAMEQLLADAKRDGVKIGVTDSYRDFAAQERVAAAKGLYSQGGLAAKPGTSNHGWGLSVDLDLDSTSRSWMRENGWRYGFVEDVPREPWHWTYRPKT